MSMNSDAQNSRGFKIPDSLKTYNYKQLKEKYYSVYPDSIPSELYAKTYLQKGKNESDTLRIAKGYHYFVHFFHKKDKQQQLSYLDSIIIVTKNVIDQNYPTKAYLMKGAIFHEQESFELALDSYLLANESAKKSNNKYLQTTARASIGVLKQLIGHYDEALKIYQECNEYYKVNKKKFFESYLINLFNLSTMYTKVQKIDSATIINNLGYKESLKVNNIAMKTDFTLNEGINQFSKKNYKVVIDSINHALPELAKARDRTNHAIAYSYLGKTYYQLAKKDSAIYFLKKSDTIFTESSKSIYPDVRDGYELLVSYYKEIGNKDEQLKAIERLMELDETLVSDYKYLNEKIEKKYDTPELLAEKENLIKTLHSKNTTSSYLIISLSILAVCSFAFIFYYYQKQHAYKRKFNELMQPKETIDPQLENQLATKEDIQEEPLPFADEIVDTLTEKLQSFEDNKEFLDPKLTIHILAEKMDTNVKYLSKVINYRKDQKFNQYLNTLRINHAIEQLQKDHTLQKYTIKAIAAQMGFNNAQSFSLAFLKQTGIYPSYFIKELQSIDN